MDPKDLAQKITKIFEVTVKDIDIKSSIVNVLVSSNKTDRHGDIVDPEAFKKRIKYYKDHPVILSSHDYRNLTSQIGEAVKVGITDNGLELGIRYYAGEGNSQADWAWVLAQKRIAAFSIGFIGHEYEWIKEKNKDTGSEYITGRKFTDVELLEVSQVLIPANRQAVQERSAEIAEEGRLADMAVKEFGDTFPVMPKAKEAASEEKENWICETCGNGFAVAKGASEFKCHCGTMCKKEVNPAVPPVNDKSHYSEGVLGDGPAKEATSHLTKETIEGVVKDAVNAALQ